jgi:hypothetical protein
MPSPQVRIASKLLGHLLWQEPTRQLRERMEDIQHAWDVAGALLQLSRDVEPSADDGASSPATPVLRPSIETRPGIAVRRSIVDRNALPVMPSSVDQWRATRTKKTLQPLEPDVRKGPSLH